MSQMNTSIDNSMKNHNPWLTSNSVGIQTWLNGPQIPLVSIFYVFIDFFENNLFNLKKNKKKIYFNSNKCPFLI